MNIPISEIRKHASVQAFLRGNRIHTYMIQNSEMTYNTPHEVHISANVAGSGNNTYSTHVYYREDLNEIVDSMCDCLAFEKYGGMCKHCVALAMQFSKEQLKFVNPGEKSEVDIKTDASLRELLYQKNVKDKAVYLQPDITGTIEIEPSIKVEWDYWDNEYVWHASFKIGNEKHMYVMKNVGQFIEAVKQNKSIRYGVKLEFIHVRSAFTQSAQQLIEAMIEIEEINEKLAGLERGASSYVYQSRGIPAKELLIKEGTKHIFLHAMMGRKWEISYGYIGEYTCKVIQGNPDLEFTLSLGNDNKNYIFELPALGTLVSKKALYLEIRNTFYECDAVYTEAMSDICKLAIRDGKKKLLINKMDMPSFCTNVLPILKQHARVKVEDELEDYSVPEVEIKIYLDKNSKAITCKIEAVYASETFIVTDYVDMEHPFRDIQREQGAFQLAKKYLEVQEGSVLLELPIQDEEQVYELLTSGISKLKLLGEVYISEVLKKMKVNSSPKVSVGVSINAGLLDVTLDIGDFPLNELEGVLQQYRRKKKFYRLKNGEFVSLQDNSLAVVSELSYGLNLKGNNFEDTHIAVPSYRALFVDQLLNKEEQGLVEVKREKSFKSLIREVKTFEDSDYEVPEFLDGIMRGYQKTGYRWIRTLDHLGFGGILADDMGLGKSIQMIAFLLAKKLESKESVTSLVVCPASLVYNWENEFYKFGGGLSVLVLAGNAQERKEALLSWREYDVVVTSYDLLKRDLELYEEEEVSFYAMAIDEAQNIKNHITQVAKAVKNIKANIRFAMTGTPIENRLSELWSIFDFLMPGMLYSYARFKKEFETPIVQVSDEDAKVRLRRAIKPFIMRRTKDEVLKELPAKNEEIIFTKLGEEQRGLYVAHANKLRESLGRKSAEEFNKSKIKILAEMTRLRQICCAPQLLYENYQGESAKMDTCMELLRNAMESGHKVLLFSQFTSVFDLIQERLKQEKIGYYRLDGSTPKQKRMEMVEIFNQDETPLFLISLKAGGTGLNLTSASIVIHFDPWWNIAAQNQATDRAHRIGQEQKVTVFKLIAKDTIEERIVNLQDAKKELSNQIISEGGALMSALTKEDFRSLLEDS